MPAESEERRIRVLIVEDEAITALAESCLIASFGFEPCGIASSGEEAIRVSLREKPGIICMDIGLAGDLDGIATASSILSQWETALIFISGYDDEERMRRALSLDPVCILKKPVSRDRLRQGLEAAVLLTRG